MGDADGAKVDRRIDARVDEREKANTRRVRVKLFKRDRVRILEKNVEARKEKKGSQQEMGHDQKKKEDKELMTEACQSNTPARLTLVHLAN